MVFGHLLAGHVEMEALSGVARSAPPPERLDQAAPGAPSPAFLSLPHSVEPKSDDEDSEPPRLEGWTCRVRFEFRHFAPPVSLDVFHIGVQHRITRGTCQAAKSPRKGAGWSPLPTHAVNAAHIVNCAHGAMAPR